jgi:hypothetical protein
MDSEKSEVVLKVIAALESLGITYLIGGSFASSVYGMPRMTNDADLVVQVKRQDIRDLFQALEPDFYVDERSMSRAVDTGRHFNVIHSGTQFKVDIFTPREGGFATHQLERRQQRQFGRAPESRAYFASPEDTVLAKLEWYRRGNEISERQWLDITEVLKVQRGRLDLNYLRHWADQLKVSDLLEEALLEAQRIDE